MLAGEVTPPGCFLDAPEVLKRQLLAFCWDCWVVEDAQASTTPRDLRFMLGQHTKGRYTAALLVFCRKKQVELTDRFLELFATDLRESSTTRLSEYGRSGQMADDLERIIEEVQDEIKQYRIRRNRLKERQKKVEDNPSSVDHYDETIAEFEEEQTLLIRLILSIQGKYPLQLMADKGLLPNYAFPETGVTLKAIVTGIRSQASAEPLDPGKRKGDYETHEWMRPASSAINELAPFNTFYAESRKVTVDQVDVGGRKNSKIERWVLCKSCHYMALKKLLPEGTKTCPACGAVGFDDVGCEHDLLKLSRVGARTDLLRARIGDEADEREQRRYRCMDFFDVQEKNWGGGWLDERLLFGFEYLRNVTLRELNVGPDGPILGQSAEIAGAKVAEEGFRICNDCGVVEDPQNKAFGPHHRFHCYYNAAGRKDRWRNVYLYRQMESEAIRVLLPVSTHRTMETVRTFQACLDLGLRLRFKGRPIHLSMREQSEPVGDGGTRRFLVLFDTVPGGTGYLEELAKLEGFKRILELAHQTMVSCPCRAQGRDGCYRCLYAYQGQYQREHISRKRGEQLISQILRGWNDLEPRPTLSDVQVDQLEESELERRFEESLGLASEKRRAGVERWNATVRGGKRCFELIVKGRSYLVEPQVTLGPDDGVGQYSNPDFLIRPEDKPAEGVLMARPVAVFTDGFGPHVQPGKDHSELAADVAKRRAIWASEGYVCWSITWEDVASFRENHNELLISLLSHPQAKVLGSAVQMAKLSLPSALNRLNAVTQLLTYLGDPNDASWQKYGAAFVLSVVAACQDNYDRYEVEELLLELLQQSRIPTRMPPVGPTADPTRFGTLQRNTMLLAAMMPLAAISKLDVDQALAVLRLEDQKTARSSDGYSESWRRFWLLTNVLQFLPRFTATTTRHVREHANDEFPDLPQVQPQELLKVAEPSAPYETRQKKIAELLEDCDDDVYDLVEALGEKDVALPVVCFELTDARDEVIADAELAWSEQKVVVLGPWQEESRLAWEKAGWTTIPIEEYESDADGLWNVLGE